MTRGAGGTEGRAVHIHYRRAPDREQVYVQELLVDAADVKITFQPDTPVPGPVEVGGRTVLEPGSPVVWFTFPDRWHDIGLFHTVDGTFTGFYANVLTPVRLHRPDQDPLRWETDDLFVDVWLGSDGHLTVLDRDELDEARTRGWIDGTVFQRALDEAAALVAGARGGSWPPPVVREWTLERARRQSSSSTSQAAERRSTST